MITPDNKIPLDDSDMDDADDQRSQQDIHSNGFDDIDEDTGEIDETDAVRQAYDAAEPSFTLDLDDDEDSYDSDDE